MDFIIPKLSEKPRPKEPCLVSQEEAWLLSDRLAFYISGGVPAMLTELETADYSDDGSLLQQRPMKREEVYDLVLRTMGTPECDRLIRMARNLRTPLEEAQRLLSMKRISSMDELMQHVAEGEPDSLSGYRRRLQAYAEYQREGDG